MVSLGPKEAVALPILERNLLSCGGVLEGSEARKGEEGRIGGERDEVGVCVR